MAINVRAQEIELSNHDHLSQIVLEIEGDENIRRKQNAWKAYQVLEGNQREFTKERLKELYPDTHSQFRVGDINMAKKVIEKLSGAYDLAPSRRLKSKTEDKALSNIYEEFSFNEAYNEADKIYNYYKYVALWLHWINPEKSMTEEGQYILRALWPFDYDLIRDEVTGKPTHFILSYADTDVTQQAGQSDGIQQTITESQSDRSAESKIYSIWSKDKFVKIKVKGKFGKIDLKVDNISFIDPVKASGLDRLPITFVSASSSVEYPVENPLHEQSIEMNVAFSDLKTASSAQGHGQLTISHPEGQEIKRVHMGMHRSISLPQSTKKDAPETKAGYINANPDLAGQLEVLKFEAVNILDDNQIKSKGAISGGVEKFSSGIDRLISEADVQGVIENNQNNKYIRLEKGTYLILKSYETAMNQTTFSSDNLEVTYPKPKVTISDKEVLDNIKLRDELGTMLDYEKHMALDPNLTVEQAKKREEEIKAQKVQAFKDTQDMLGTNDTEDPEDNEDDTLAPEDKKPLPVN